MDAGGRRSAPELARRMGSNTMGEAADGTTGRVEALPLRGFPGR